MIKLNFSNDCFKFHKLFSITFLHDAYSDVKDILRDVSIVPDEATGQLLKGYHLLSKSESNMFLCFVQTIAMIDTSGGSPKKVTIVNKPMNNFNEDATLTFRMINSSSRFFDNTNLRVH